MKRDYKLYINDIKESINQIEKYTQKLSQEDFNKNKLIQDAVIRRLEIIGEASRNIPRALKEKNKHVPWFDMSQFRDLMAHSYFEVTLRRIWRSVKENIPLIKKAISNISLI